METALAPPHASYGWSLGLRATTASAVIERIERGFSIASVDRLRQRLGLSADEAADIVGASARTLARRRKEGRLAADESDRLYRLARLFERAVAVFYTGDQAETEADARRWFKQPQWALGGATPLAYAHTEPGAREVEDLLDRIEYGVLA